MMLTPWSSINFMSTIIIGWICFFLFLPLRLFIRDGWIIPDNFNLHLPHWCLDSGHHHQQHHHHHQQHQNCHHHNHQITIPKNSISMQIFRRLLFWGKYYKRYLIEHNFQKAIREHLAEKLPNSVAKHRWEVWWEEYDWWRHTRPLPPHIKFPFVFKSDQNKVKIETITRSKHIMWKCQGQKVKL